MCRGVAIKAFQLLRDFEQPGGDRLAVALLLQFGFDRDGLCQAYRIGGIVGDELAQPVDLPVGHLQHAPHVAQHGPRLQTCRG